MTAEPAAEIIDPSLTHAIKDWNDYSSESVKNALIVMEAITPIKDTVQVTQQVIQALQETDWKPDNKKLLDPESLLAAGRELAEIQKAAIERMLEAYNEYLKVTRQAGDKYAEKLKAAKSPQQLLAAWLEASLEMVKEYQSGINDQASTLGTVQSAYKAWLQNTLQNLSAK